MGENKGQTTFLSVIGIATLLVAIIGATFAYFTTSMTDKGNTGSQITTATLSTATFQVTAGTAKTDMFPGDSFNDTTVEVKGGDIPTGASVPYTCTVSVEGTGKIAAKDILWSTDGVAETSLATTNTFSGTLAAGTDVSKTWTIKAKLVESGAAQNELQGSTNNIKVVCDVTGGELKYTAGGKQYTE